MAEHDLDWFMHNENEEHFAKLTPEQHVHLTNGGTVDIGETEPAQAAEESSGSPAAAGETKDVDGEGKGEPVVMARDGKHTIPFEEHRAAKDRAQYAEQELARATQMLQAQEQIIADLKAAKTADAGTGGTAAQDSVVDKFSKFLEENPEFAPLAPVLKDLVDSTTEARTAALEKKLEEALLPLQQKAQQSEFMSAHEYVHKAIPDFDELVNSGDVEKWIMTLPGYARPGALAVYNSDQVNGETAKALVELFGQYKEATGKSQPKPEPTPSKEEIRAAAEKAAAAARPKTPATLNDIPAAGTSSATETPVTAQQWNSHFAGKSPEQILAELAR